MREPTRDFVVKQGRDKVDLSSLVNVCSLIGGIKGMIAQCYCFKGNSQEFNSYLGKALAIDPGNELARDIQSSRCKFICVTDNLSLK
jgi:hypothetical protein